jgi:hypothetical protein
MDIFLESSFNFNSLYPYFQHPKSHPIYIPIVFSLKLYRILVEFFCR